MKRTATHEQRRCRVTDPRAEQAGTPMQRGEKLSGKHGYAIMYFTGTFARMSISLGHIFKVESGELICATSC